MQGIRLVDVDLSLFVLLLLLEGVGLEAMATGQPEYYNLDPLAAPSHLWLRFAVTTCFWLGIGSLQYIYNAYIRSRFVSDPAAQFVDLLCLGNLSCLILDEPVRLLALCIFVGFVLSCCLFACLLG